MHCVQVNEKTQMDKSEAIFEVYTDIIVNKMEDDSKALLWIVTLDAKRISEICVCSYS